MRAITLEELYLLLTTAPAGSFLALVAFTALVFALVRAFAPAPALVAGNTDLALVALAAIIDSTDLHRDRPLEGHRRGV